MADLKKLSELVIETYKKSDQDFAHWMLENHLPIVAKLDPKYRKLPLMVEF